MIAFDTYRVLYYEARQYEDIDRYILERGWQGWMNSIGDADRIADLLRAVYAISKGGLDGVLTVEGENTKLISFCNRYVLNYSTVQKWKLKLSTPSEDRLLHIGYSVISNKFV